MLSPVEQNFALYIPKLFFTGNRELPFFVTIHKPDQVRYTIPKGGSIDNFGVMIDVDSKIGPVSRVGWGIEVGKKLVTCVPRQCGENVAPGMSVGVGVGVRSGATALGEDDMQLARRSMTLENKNNFSFIIINPGVN
jgi:hypothetical protein